MDLTTSSPSKKLKLRQRWLWLHAQLKLVYLLGQYLSDDLVLNA